MYGTLWSRQRTDVVRSDQIGDRPDQCNSEQERNCRNNHHHCCAVTEPQPPQESDHGQDSKAADKAHASGSPSVGMISCWVCVKAEEALAAETAHAQELLESR
jgi:hypothetical protein